MCGGDEGNVWGVDREWRGEGNGWGVGGEWRGWE